MSHLNRVSTRLTLAAFLVAGLSAATGCGGAPSEVDTAETIRPDSAKPATPPDVTPAKETGKP